MPVWVREGHEVVRHLGARFDELHDSTSTPITSRRHWLQSWVESYPDYRPIAVGVDAADGTLDAVAVLGSRRVGGVHQVVAGGHGPSDAVMLPARDEEAATLLAGALADELHRRYGAWRLVLRHVVPQDLVAPRLAQRLAYVRLVPGDVSPVLAADSGPSLGSYVTSSHRRGISRIRNRMKRDDLEPEIRHLEKPADIAAIMPEVERVFRSRDIALGRRPALDEAVERDFFRKVIELHATAGQVCLTTLHLQGRLAAYVLCFVDGDVYRMWNCRFDPDWDRFSPGKLAMDESVSHALSAGGTAYDFMRGQERYKASYANEQMAGLDLYASSGALLAAGNAMFLAARTRMREMDEGAGRGARVIAETRRVREKWGL